LSVRTHTKLHISVSNLLASVAHDPDLRKQACDSYEAAHALRPASHAALYNWGVALSDMARLLKAVNPGASYDLLLAATEKYGRSLEHNPNHPQARHAGAPAGPPALCHAHRNKLNTKLAATQAPTA